MIDLRQRSIEIILANQAANGAYVACPNFSQYKYCWLRDGTFVAFAMDRVGRHDSAGAFYAWVSETLRGRAAAVGRIEDALRAGRDPAPRDLLPARFRLDGQVAEDDWPNFQLDGYGTWLWGLDRHLEMIGVNGLPDRFGTAVDLTVRYLAACWRRPNYDCWEEFGDRLHPATLAAIYGGLAAIDRRLRRDGLADLAGQIKNFVLTEGTAGGRFIKSCGNPGIDANLLWLTLPFGLVEPDDPRMAATVAEIKRRLCHRGVHRYPEDTYYGGGEWLLLACWLGWYYCRVGRSAEAGRIAAWVQSCAGAEGELPEQVLDHVNHPEYIGQWEERWGKVATPLLWSHAMYLVLLDELAHVKEG